MATGYSFARGDVIALALQVTGGDPMLVQTMQAAIRPVSSGTQFGNPLGNPSAQALIGFVPATSSVAAYWLIAITSEDSYYLTAGTYIIDALLSVDGITVTTYPAIILINEPATRPAQPDTSGYGGPWINPRPDTSGSALSLRWADATQTISFTFPALGMNVDPNLIALLETIMAPTTWPIGTSINFTQSATVMIQVDGLAGGDTLQITQSLTSVIYYNSVIRDPAGNKLASISANGSYLVDAWTNLKLTQAGSVSTPTVTYYGNAGF